VTEKSQQQPPGLEGGAAWGTEDEQWRSSSGGGGGSGSGSGGSGVIAGGVQVGESSRGRVVGSEASKLAKPRNDRYQGIV
jgi:hypothetical protein